MISRAIDNEAADVDLGSNPKAYKEADVTRDSSELQNMVNMYNSLAKANITYTFGDETVTLDGNTIKNWLQFDEKGQLLPDDGAFRQHVVDYVAQLAADHDTVGTEDNLRPQAEGLCMYMAQPMDGRLIRTRKQHSSCRKFNQEPRQPGNRYIL